ncbi:MAG TPA: hypothetical protein PKK18_11100 [Chitinophagales bacterium]|nr:hypothetical protein [Chitinophagales bacterium]HNC72609.1 hypothetical protein [Chitinophagales bacterium]HNF19720.1 hypothetical protein [Chitinophagales bacterium]HNG71985.1 hypothetical protein [Chitinophagales bacterium]HNJ02459.1 hypothetical protein [Chitinophagales bacterium]
MENLIELVQIINKRKLSQIEILDKSLLSRKDTLFSKLYNGIADGIIKNDDDALQYLYGNDKESTNYRKLKSRFKERLLNTLYFIDMNHTAESDSSKKAYFDCMNHLYLSNILLRYAENRNASIQLILDNYTSAKKHHFFDILKEYSYKLVVHYGMSGNEKKYTEELSAYKQYYNEYDFEQKAQLIYTNVMMITHYAKNATEIKEKEIKKCCDEIEALVKQSQSLVVFFIYIRTLLFYHEIKGDNVNINKTCDKYLSQYKKYLSSILSDSYLNTIYIYKLKSLFDLRKDEESLHLIDTILPNAKGASFLAVNEFKMKILLNQQNTQAARETLHHIHSSTYFKSANALLKERWFVYNAFLEFIEQYKNNGNFKFSLSKFNNDIPLVSQDKSGFNFAARVINILFYIGRNDLDNAMQHIEALKIYQIRHFKEDTYFRSIQFTKQLLSVEKKSFNYKELHKIYDSNHLLGQDDKHVIHESEIIRYDKLWQIILNTLKRNEQ